jgi:DNA-binding winged helix-turn-helix (wHTH) protein
VSPRFRFGPFLVSPAHRVLRRDNIDVPLIPRYFDLLLLLLTHRNRAVTRQEIFDSVWKDVVVSDGALSQAIRTVRRALGDDPREPQFIRTVARHGYQFVAADVTEEADETPLPPVRANRADADAAAVCRSADPYGPLLDRLLRAGSPDRGSEEDRRDAAEQLHVLGTREALRRLDALPGHEEARAILRDTRWDVAGAGDVPLLGSQGASRTIRSLVRLRLRRAARVASNRLASASVGGAVAGVLAGTVGGVALWLLPESQATPDLVVALALVGGVAGALGAAGLGAGLALAEALARSHRMLGLTLCGAVAGGLTGGLAHRLTRAVISGIFGREVQEVAGAFEGLVLGAAAGFGYAVSTAVLPGGGMATPRGPFRLRTALFTGLACAAAAILLSAANFHLVGSSLDVIAEVFQGSDVALAPIGRLLGEQELRPVTRMLVSALEGLLFGAGLAFGLTHRPGRG